MTDPDDDRTVLLIERDRSIVQRVAEALAGTETADHAAHERLVHEERVDDGVAAARRGDFAAVLVGPSVGDDSTTATDGGDGPLRRLEGATVGTPVVELVDRTTSTGGGRGGLSDVADVLVRVDAEDQSALRRIVDGGARDGPAADAGREDLSTLQRAAGRLADADRRSDVVDAVAEAVVDGLGGGAATVALYDGSDQSLRPAGTGGPDRRPAECGPLADDGAAWTAFVEGESRRVAEADRECLIQPVGRFGVVVVESDDGAALTEMAPAVAHLATVAQTALGRLAERDDRREAERRVGRMEDRRDRLEELLRAARLVGRARREASSREELERTVCRGLCDGEWTQSAWIAQTDPGTRGIAPRATSGTDEPLVSAVVDGSREGETDPTARALETGTVQVENGLDRDPPFEPWLKEALRRGVGSVLSVPLAHGDDQYGALTLYRSNDEGFTDTERDVFAELGAAVAHGVNGLVQKQALTGDGAVELEFAVRGDRLRALQLLQDTGGARFEFRNVVQNDDGSMKVFFSLQGADPEAADRFAQQSLVVEDYALLAKEEDELHFECTLVGSNILSVMFEHGAVPQSITAVDGEARLTVEVPQNVDVRRFTEMFQEKYGDVEFLARRTRDRPIRTLQKFQVRLEERLTDRQEQVLRTAYWSGFYDWPRQNNGKEIAARLDISQPTFARHLRAAERRLLALLFEDENGD
jgi:predicted DNA binding protein